MRSPVIFQSEEFKCRLISLSGMAREILEENDHYLVRQHQILQAFYLGAKFNDITILEKAGFPTQGWNEFIVFSPVL